MSESTPVEPAASGLEVRTCFVRHRNALPARADLGELFVNPASALRGAACRHASGAEVFVADTK